MEANRCFEHTQPWFLSLWFLDDSRHRAFAVSGVAITMVRSRYTFPRCYAIEQLSCGTLILILIQVIANFNKSTILIFSSLLPPSDDFVVGFLSLRTYQVTFLAVCVRRHMLFAELGLMFLGVHQVMCGNAVHDHVTLTPNPCRSAKNIDWWAIHRLFIDTSKLFFQVHTTQSWIKSTNDHLAGDCSRFIIPQTCLAPALTCRRQGTSRAPQLLKANRAKGSAATSLMIFLPLAVTAGCPYNFRERFAVSHVKSQHISLPPRCSILWKPSSLIASTYNEYHRRSGAERHNMHA